MGSCVCCCSKSSEEPHKTTTISRTSSQNSIARDHEEVHNSHTQTLSSPDGNTSPPVSKLDPVTDFPAPPPLRVPVVSIVFSPASTEGSKCAYCDKPDGDFHDYFHVLSSMPLDHFEEFMEAGWWRTGKLLFRPRFDIVCCPGYAMRLPVKEYNLTKKHRRVIKRWAEFLKNGDPQWENRGNHSLSTGPSPTSKDQPSPEVSKRNIKRPVRAGEGRDPNKPPCRKAKEQKAERFRAKTNSADIPQSSNNASSQSLTDFMDQNFKTSLTGLKHQFDVKLVACSPMDPLLKATIPQAYKLYDKLQRIVHQGKSRFKSEEDFTDGFCCSCLNNSGYHDPPQGSYHLQYYLDTKLIMYSIVDITPRYFVSVYFVYDPDLRFLSPGIFTCLYEIAMVQQLRQRLPNLEYYGLGYYNHYDDKSSYKRQFKPQEVLCNETNTFVSLEPCIPKFLGGGYCRLADDSIPEKDGRTASIDAICVSKRRLNLGPFSALPEREKERYREVLKQFVCEAGGSAAQKCNVDLMINFKT